MLKDAKVRIQISVNEETNAALDKACRSLGISKSAAASVAINEWIAKLSRENSIKK